MFWLVTIWILQRLISELNSPIVKSFAYFKVNACYVAATVDRGWPTTKYHTHQLEHKGNE